MTEKTVDIMLHIDESTTHNVREDLLDSLYTINGVSTASYNEDKPHLLIIKYNPNVIHPDEFIKEAQNRDLHAELIGM